MDLELFGSPASLNLWLRIGNVLLKLCLLPPSRHCEFPHPHTLFQVRTSTAVHVKVKSPGRDFKGRRLIQFEQISRFDSSVQDYISKHRTVGHRWASAGIGLPPAWCCMYDSRPVLASVYHQLDAVCMTVGHRWVSAVISLPPAWWCIFAAL